jgi:hypothetical protein
MSFFKKVFGEKAKPAPTLPQAIRRLKLTQDVLLKRQTALEDKIKKEIATARKNASTNKKRKPLVKLTRLCRTFGNFSCFASRAEKEAVRAAAPAARRGPDDPRGATGDIGKRQY